MRRTAGEGGWRRGKGRGERRGRREFVLCPKKKEENAAPKKQDQICSKSEAGLVIKLYTLAPK